MQTDSKNTKVRTSGSVSSELKYPCWIAAFTRASANIGIPQTYVEWSGIYALSCILGRHVYSQNARGTVYPNLYVLMVGPPATGKSEAEDLLRPFLKDLDVKLAAQHVSKAALIDELAKAHVRKITPNGMVDYHGLSLLTSEFIETFPDYDVRFLGMLARWWDCPPYIKESKRHLKEPIIINDICCTIMAGVQPGILAHAFPAEAWNGGFLSRTILLYVPTKIELMLYSLGKASTKTAGRKLDTKVYADLVKDLTTISKLMGQMVQDETYIEAYLDWRAGGQNPKPRHPKLMYYNLRREHNLEKLSIISAASRGSMVLTGDDYARARGWLESAELNVDDIFLEMAAGDDAVLMRDLHAFIIRRAQGAGKLMREIEVRRYLTSRIPSQRMESFLSVAESAGYIRIEQGAAGVRMIAACVLDAIYD